MTLVGFIPGFVLGLLAMRRSPDTDQRRHSHTWRYVCTSGGRMYYLCPCGEWAERRPDGDA